MTVTMKDEDGSIQWHPVASSGIQTNPNKKNQNKGVFNTTIKLELLITIIISVISLS
jgi:hypothetical protein